MISVILPTEKSSVSRGSHSKAEARSGKFTGTPCK
jgi:hypothetical protein